jgi:hypothetical protein
MAAESEQAERKEQQWQKENMATAYHEHEQGKCKADSKHTYQRTPSKTVPFRANAAAGPQ